MAVTLTGDNSTLVRLLLKQRASFIVAGGTAVAHYGCRAAWPPADDMDLLVEPTQPNAQAIDAALYAAGIPNASIDSAMRNRRPLQVRFVAYRVDFVPLPEGADFGDLASRCQIARTQPDDHEVRVLGVRDLIAMKRAAVASATATLDKHSRDLECLTKL